MSTLGNRVFSRRMRSILNQSFSESLEILPDVLDEIILELIEQAAQYQLTLETEVAPFVICAWLFGVPFDTNFPAVREVLEDAAMSGEEKAEFLWNFAEFGMEILEESELDVSQ